MSEINGVQLLSQLKAMAAAAAGPDNSVANAGAAGQVNFSELLLKAVDHVNASQQEVSQLRQAFQTGNNDVDITQVMIASQKASVEFQMMMQARNRLISAYQEIMSMQI